MIYPQPCYYFHLPKNELSALDLTGNIDYDSFRRPLSFLRAVDVQFSSSASHVA